MMKKFFAIIAVSLFMTACGSGDEDAAEAARIQDSVKRAADSVAQTGDTTALNGIMGDSSSAVGTMNTDSMK